MVNAGIAITKTIAAVITGSGAMLAELFTHLPIVEIRDYFFWD